MTPPFIPKLLHQEDTQYFDKYDNEENEWKFVEDNQEGHLRRSSSLGNQYQYNFAGFDWQPVQKYKENDVFDETFKKLSSMKKIKRTLSPNFKRIKT